MRRLPPCRWSPSSLCLVAALTAGCGSTDDAEKAVRDASNEAVAASKKAAGDLADKASDEATKLGNRASDEATKLGTKAADEATRLGDEAAEATKDAAGELADKAIDATKAAAEVTKDGAVAIYEDLRDDGELSRTAKGWLAAQAKGTSIESLVIKGAQLTPVALEASSVLLEAVDSDTAVEPIFQRIDEDPATVDAAIGDMPRVEVVEDVTVGFKQLEGFEGSDHVKERGFLVMWRYEDHLVGFVYRSRRTIDLAMVVAETPRLIRLTQKALEE